MILMRVRAILLALLATGCFESEGPVTPDGESESWAEFEAKFQAKYFDDPISVEGRLIDADGSPVIGASVELGEHQSQTFAGGRFEFADVTRRNRTLVLKADGFRDRLLPVYLLRPQTDEMVSLGDIVMEAASGSRLRFGGDVQLGRRYLDPDENTPLDQVPEPHPNALIASDDPEPGTREVVGGIRPLMSAADFTSVNLETVVTDTPSEPGENAFVFFTLPGSLPALSWMGVDHVSLANNHIYDYAHQGVVDTIANLNAAQIPYSGAGMNPAEAFAGHRVAVGPNNFSLISMVSIEGARGEHATAATEERSGSANLNEDEWITDAFAQETSDGYLAIGEIHTGYEYMESPPNDGYTRERMHFVVDAGAALVVAHHPHVPQGFEFHNDVMIAHSLGNLVFDQERLDVAYGIALTTDFDDDGAQSDAFVHPIYVEGFKSGLVAPERSEWIIRRMAYSSNPYGVNVIPELGRGYITPTADWIRTERTVEVELIDGVADLRQVRHFGESLVTVDSPSPVEIGRDLLWFGDMEDMDVDDTDEIDRWYYTGGGSFPCFHDSHSGAQAICATRTSGSLSEVVIAFRQRMRVLGDKRNQPNKNLSFFGYTSGQNTGTVRVVATYTASFLGKQFGEETVYERGPGSYEWTPFGANLNLPPDDPSIVPEDGKPYDPRLRTENARAVRITIYMGRTEEGEGIVRFDDLALISWEPGDNLEEISTHNPFDFVRTDVDTSNIRVTFARWSRE